MKIRVLHIIDHLGYGGAQIAVKNIVEKINSEHIETFVCMLRTNTNTIPIQTKLINLAYHKYNPFAFLAIARLCKEYKIDIIQAHLQKSVMLCLLAGFLCNTKIIIHEHGPIFRRGTGFIYRLFLRAFGSKATMAIANSHTTKTAMVRKAGFNEESIQVVSNFIDFTRFDRNLYDRDKARELLGIAQDNIVVGFVGRLDHCKGVDLLIETAAIFCKESERYCFVIVGEGSQRQELERLVHQLGLKKKVIFTGLYKNPAEIMIAFDVGVIPSRREAFGITAIELMYMKIPVVASPVGGLVEHVRHRETGILLSQLDAREIVQAILTLRKEEALCQNIIKNAQNYTQRFNGFEQIEQIKRTYNMVGAGRNFSS